MTNLYNFMDGANGLAGGMTVIGFGILIEIDAATGFLRVTVEWIEVIGDGKNKRVNKVDSVNKVDTDCKQSLHKTVNKVTPNIEAKSDNKIDESDIEEKKKNAQLEEAFELIDEHFALKAEKEKAPQIAPPPPVADPVGSATDRALEWATQESETIKSWYITFRVQAPTPEDFKADVFSFFSHYQTAQMELNGVPGMAEKDPVLFFQRRFSSWINNGKSIKKINESRQQKRNYGTAIGKGNSL